MGVSVSVGPRGIAPPELYVDALLGYSLRGDPRPEAAALIRATAGCRVLSLDVPSGLELEQGVVRDPAVRAAATLTLALPKQALKLAAAQELVGELYLGVVTK